MAETIVTVLQDVSAKIIAVAPQGVAGAQGLQGPAGAQGPKGDTGERGVQGPSGGDSAYTIAVNAGFIGTESDWLLSLKGDVGGTGSNGTDGLSAYEIAVSNGFVGNEAAWLLSLKGNAGTNGTNGVDGADGLSAYEVAVQNGFLGTESAWLLSLKGDKGDTGNTGAKGNTGNTGANGLSAYQVAVAGGYVGTESAWLLSLKGDKGDVGDTGPQGIQGIQGLKGDTGDSGVSSLTQLTDVSIINPAQDEVLSFNGTEWVNSPAPESNNQFPLDIDRYGFINQNQTLLAFDDTTKTLTLTPVGLEFVYYRAGVRCTVTTQKSISLASAIDGSKHFIYMESNTGELTASTTPWGIDDQKVMVAILYWDSTQTPKYMLSDERHTCLIDRRSHFIHHYTEGTKLKTVGAITGYTLTTDTLDAKSIAIADTVLLDEDLIIPVTGIADNVGVGNVYPMLYRTAPTTWKWKYTNIPLSFTNTFAEYDNNGTLTASSNGRWVNTYLCFSDVVGDFRLFFINGRGSFTSLALAQAESPSTFTFDSFPTAEFVIAYRFTWALANANSSAHGKATLAAAPALVTTSAISTASTVSGIDHATLTNIQGGGTGEYYHLTQAQSSALSSVGYGGGSITTNFAAGTNALSNHAASASGGNNVVIGADAAPADYASHDNVLMGWEAGKTLTSGVSGFTITSGGTGYTGTPTLTVSAPAAGGTQSTAIVGLVGGVVSYFSSIVAGTKYDSTATATIAGTGSGAVVVPVVNAGSYNVALGAQALRSSASSYEQVAIGYKALYSLTTPTQTTANTAVGTRALTSATTSSAMTAVGFEALKTVGATQSDTTAIGAAAFQNGSIITAGVAVGAKAGQNVNASYATLVGYYAGSSAVANSTFIGSQAGFLNTGTANTSVGYLAIGASGNGAYNTAVGYESLKALTSGSYNTAIGWEALKAQLTGNYNTAVGCRSLKSAVGAATHNTALGYLSGVAVTTGTSNTLIGTQAGESLTIGVENTFIGRLAGLLHSEGSNNTCIGFNSAPSSNSVSNQITLGNGSITALRCAATSITAVSDVRDKTHIAPLPVGLEFVKHLKPSTFTWNARDKSKVGISAAGFIAQDLQAAQDLFGAEYLDLVDTENPDKLEARYANLLPVAIQAIIDLSKQNDELATRLALLETRLNA